MTETKSLLWTITDGIVVSPFHNCLLEDNPILYGSSTKNRNFLTATISRGTVLGFSLTYNLHYQKFSGLRLTKLVERFASETSAASR